MIRFLEWLLAKLHHTNEYIVFRQIFPAPIDTGTAWVAYEAAPQIAASAYEASRQLARDSGEGGIFFAVTRDEFETFHFDAPRDEGYLKDIV